MADPQKQQLFSPATSAANDMVWLLLALAAQQTWNIGVRSVIYQPMNN